METNDNQIAIEEILERVAPAINELLFAKCLGKSEIAKIVKKRRDFEYKIYAPDRTKDVYLKYLEFELNFLQLSLTRKKMRRIQKLEHFSKTLEHIFGIFKRALHKHKKDLLLWKTFLDFCVRFQYRVESAIEDSLQKNPMQPDLWILGAKWYYEYNNDIESARHLLRRGVKLNKQSPKLWLEFFKLEMSFAAPDPAEYVQQEDAEEEEQAATEEAQEDKIIVKEEKKEAPKKKFEADPSKLYEIPLLIAEKAKSTLPNHFDLQFEMVDILSCYVNTEVLQNKMLQSIIEYFQSNEYCIYRAICFKLTQQLNYFSKLQAESKKLQPETPEFQQSEQAKQAQIKRIEETEKQTFDALLRCTEQICPSVKMWDYVVKFCIDAVVRHSKVFQTEHDKTTALSYLDTLLNTVFIKASQLHKLNEEMICEYIQILLQLGYSKEAMQICEAVLSKSENKRIQHSQMIWLAYVRLLIRNGQNVEAIEKAVDSAVKHVTVFGQSEEEQYWQQVTDLTQHREEFLKVRQEKFNKRLEFWTAVLQFSIMHSSYEKIQELFKAAIKDCNCLFIKKKYFEWELMANGVESAQAVIQMLLSLPPNSAELFKMLIEFAKTQQNESLLINLFSRALLDHGKTDEDFWIEYISYMRSKNNITKAHSLYQEAIKTLKDNKQFVLKYNQL